MSTIYDTFEQAITEDGDTDFDLITGRTYVIAIGNTFASGSLTFFYVDASGNEIPIPEAGATDGEGSPLTITTASVFELTAATSILRVTAADSTGSTDIDVTVTVKRDASRNGG